MNALVTGGLGFIGSHIVDCLREKNHFVRVIDNLSSETHPSKKLPPYFDSNTELVLGDLNDCESLIKATEGIDTIFHEASFVRAGESMLSPAKYVHNNSFGTAAMLDFLLNHETNIKKIIVASTSSVYGEGLYNCQNCGVVEPTERKKERLEKKDYEQYCHSCNLMLTPIETPETKTCAPTSVYAFTKKSQEDLALLFGKTHGFDVTVLRYFNAYGSRQPLDSPHTGAIASLAARIKNGSPPAIYEDGLHSRDFVDARDIAKANLLAAESNVARNEIFNVGTGIRTTFQEMAQKLIDISGNSFKPKITFNARMGDIRHCYANNRKIAKMLEFTPRFSIQEGLTHLWNWAKTENAIDVFKENEAITKKIYI